SRISSTRDVSAVSPGSEWRALASGSVPLASPLVNDAAANPIATPRTVPAMPLIHAVEPVAMVAPNGRRVGRAGILGGGNSIGYGGSPPRGRGVDHPPREDRRDPDPLRDPHRARRRDGARRDGREDGERGAPRQSDETSPPRVATHCERERGDGDRPPDP